MSANQLDRLVAGLASVRDEDVGTAGSELLLRRIVSAPLPSSHTRRRLLVAAVASAVLVAAPALALRGQIVHLFARSEEAPAPVALSFQNEPGTPPQFRLGSARLIFHLPTMDGPVRVWAAPHPSGFCYAVGTAGHVGLNSSCISRDDSAELDVRDFEERRKPEPNWPPAGRGVASDGMTWYGEVLVGFSLNHDARSVRVRFENGRQQTVPLTWISPPIDAGFFALWTSKAHWADGRERFQFSALDSSGGTLATTAAEVTAPWLLKSGSDAPREVDAPAG